jgi:hypothetical protein
MEGGEGGAVTSFANECAFGGHCLFFFNWPHQIFFNWPPQKSDAAREHKTGSDFVRAKKKHDFVLTEVLVASNLMRQVAGDPNKTEFTKKKNRQ